MECKLCNSSDIKEIKVKEKYYYCNNCELIFIEPDKLPDYDREHEVYCGHENTHENKGYVNMFKEFIDNYIIYYKNEIEDVLEYGCGPGPVLADLLEELDFNVYKYDPFFYSDFDYKNKKYDLITSTEVFEHFFDPKNEINKLVQLIKPGKYLAVMTSFHQGIEHFKDWWYKRDPTHVSFYSLKTFQYIEENHSLEIVKTKNNKGILFKRTD